MTTDTAFAIAALRARGHRPHPADPGTSRALAVAAARAGRTLVDLPGGQVTLGWLDGSEPVGGGDTGVVRISPSTWLVLTFTAALRACWTNKANHPFPGQPAPIESVLAAVAALGTLAGATGADAANGALWQQKGSLPYLYRAGLLIEDSETDSVRLGPRVAVWSDREVETLRYVYDQMPAAPNGQSGGGS